MNQGDGLEDFSLMTTAFYSLNSEFGRAAYARSREAMSNIARDSGTSYYANVVARVGRA